MLFKLHMCALTYPGAHLSILRKVATDLEGTVVRTFKRDILEHCPVVTVYGGERPRWYDYDNGSRIWLGGLDKPGKTLSAERDLVYVNQCEELSVSDWEYLTRVVTGRGSKMPYTQLLGDCNPASHTHWILARRDEGKLTFFEAYHRDNPDLWDHEQEAWTPHGEARVERLRNLTGTRYLRLYLGMWAPPEGAIYDVYEDDRHKVKAFEIPRLWPKFVGVDPFGAHIAAIWIAFDPQAQVLHVYREYREPFGVTTTNHATNVLELSGYTARGKATERAENIYAWVGGAKSERQQRVDWSWAGVPLVEPPFADVWAGIDRVYNLLQGYRLFIHDTCPNLISEIGEYRRKMDRQGNPTEQIENKNSYHQLDCLRYIIAWLSQPSEQIEIVNRMVPIGPAY
jgi:hypothetical protein